MTLAFNISLVPLLGYLGAGIACVLCYSTMAVLAFYWGRNRYPIPYNWKPLLLYLGVSLLLIYGSIQISLQNFWFDSLLNLVGFGAFISVMIGIERERRKRS